MPEERPGASVNQQGTYGSYQTNQYDTEPPAYTPRAEDIPSQMTRDTPMYIPGQEDAPAYTPRHEDTPSCSIRGTQVHIPHTETTTVYTPQQQETQLQSTQQEHTNSRRHKYQTDDIDSDS